jgi:hypothetical protein
LACVENFGNCSQAVDKSRVRRIDRPPIPEAECIFELRLNGFVGALQPFGVSGLKGLFCRCLLALNRAVRCTLPRDSPVVGCETGCEADATGNEADCLQAEGQARSG